MSTRAMDLFDEYRANSLTVSNALLKTCILIEEQEKLLLTARAELEAEKKTGHEKSVTILNLEDKIKDLRQQLNWAQLLAKQYLEALEKSRDELEAACAAMDTNDPA